MSRCNKHPLISLKIDARNITTWSEWSSLVTVVVTEAALMLSPQQSSPHWHNVMSPLLSLSLSPCPGFHRYTLDGLWLHLTFIYIWARFYKEALLFTISKKYLIIRTHIFMHNDAMLMCTESHCSLSLTALRSPVCWTSVQCRPLTAGWSAHISRRSPLRPPLQRWQICVRKKWDLFSEWKLRESPLICSPYYAFMLISSEAAVTSRLLISVTKYLVTLTPSHRHTSVTLARVTRICYNTLLH